MDRDALLARVRMLSLIEDTNVSDAEIVAIMADCYHEVSLITNWAWLEASETLTVAADTQTYALPTSFETMVAIADDDNDNLIPYIGPQEFFKQVGNDTGNTSTTPTFYTIWEDLIYFTPTPSTADTDRFTCYYYKAVTVPATGGATPEFHAAFHPMIVEYALWKLYNREEYFDQSERAFITYARYLQQMQTHYATRTTFPNMIAGDGRFNKGVGDPNIPTLRNL